MPRNLVTCYRKDCQATGSVQLVRKGQGVTHLCKVCHREWLTALGGALKAFLDTPRADSKEPGLE